MSNFLVMIQNSNILITNYANRKAIAGRKFINLMPDFFYNTNSLIVF